MDSADVMKQAELAGQFLEEAGVRYFASHFDPNAATEARTLSLAGWAIAVLANGVKVQNVLNTLNLAQQVGLTEEELGKELEASYGVGEAKSASIRARILEMRRLEELGEGK